MRASRAVGIALGVAVIVGAGCGGASTLPPAGSTAIPADNLSETIAVSNAAWLEWKDGAGKFLDRDFFDCYELNGVPRPASTPAPDPSGHSRSRRGCDEALAEIEKALPQYQQFAQDVKAIQVLGTNSPHQEQFDALVSARSQRGDWAQATVAAWKKKDNASLELMRRKVPELAELEARALGVDPTGARPAPFPTLDYIPGVPTGTPPGR